MAAGKKSRDQLILAYKLDKNRSEIALESRRWQREEKNETDYVIIRDHMKQQKAGKVREPKYRKRSA